jgi:beta-galactosidase
MKILLCLLLINLSFLNTGFSQNKLRTSENFNKDWKFILDSTKDYSQLSTNVKNWRGLNLPHDWSIELPFDSASPTGNGGGALRGGLGWYTKEFTVPLADKDKVISIHFDGVYCRSSVWINGHLLGYRPSGYISFSYDLNPYLNYGKKNILVVKVNNNEQPNSRWYSGSGIYRNVWLQKTGKVCVADWGTYITTEPLNESASRVTIKTTVKGGGKLMGYTIKVNLYNALGEMVATEESLIIHRDKNKTATDEAAVKKAIEALDTAEVFTNSLVVKSAHLWNLNDPYQYKAVVKIMNGDKVLDEYNTSFGIRSFEFDANKGFILNGKSVKINGVCDHHDLGCLGTAINVRALERQLEILKAMGCNGIRTSHNPPAPELLDLCDKMGFIVMDEAFDMWKKQKNPYDYHLDWDQWHKKDLQDMVLRDRNHPSVFIWSIGNEIPEQWDSTGLVIGKELADIVKILDPTRPITSALNDPQPGNKIYLSGGVDLVGFNYHHPDFAKFPTNFPGKKFIGTETVSALETRGQYDLIPSDSIRRWPARWDIPFNEGNKDLTVSAYDNVSAPWGSTHEETWKEIKKHDFISGQYIWTGFDYIGEPTPYPWPARSSYFGIIDLAGFPKDVYYMYQSEWTDKTVLHLLPHWNWKAGNMVDVWAYYNNADEVELFLNGKSLGVRKKAGDDLHVTWTVPFTPGTLKAISRKAGKIVLTTEIKTAGAPARIILSADRKQIKADGNDLSFITAKVVDANGVVVPDASNLIEFSVNGEAEIVGTDNGCQTSMESFKSKNHKAFNGLCLAVIQSKEKKSTVIVKATSKGLQPAAVAIVME